MGVGASLAAGPVGRAANAATDAQMQAEILSYSRARGVLAGIDISGGALCPDKDANIDVYGPAFVPKAIVFGDVPPPPEAAPLLKELRRQAAATTGDKVASRSVVSVLRRFANARDGRPAVNPESRAARRWQQAATDPDSLGGHMPSCERLDRLETALHPEPQLSRQT